MPLTSGTRASHLWSDPELRQRLLVNLSEDEVLTPLKIVTNLLALLKK
jgi:hypothetical protein